MRLSYRCVCETSGEVPKRQGKLFYMISDVMTCDNGLCGGPNNNGIPLELNADYLSSYFKVLIMPGVWVMSDNEVNGLTRFLEMTPGEFKDLFSLRCSVLNNNSRPLTLMASIGSIVIATEGGVGMWEEDLSSGRGRTGIFTSLPLIMVWLV